MVQHSFTINDDTLNQSITTLKQGSNSFFPHYFMKNSVVNKKDEHLHLSYVAELGTKNSRNGRFGINIMIIILVTIMMKIFCGPIGRSAAAFFVTSSSKEIIILG